MTFLFRNIGLTKSLQSILFWCSIVITCLCIIPISKLKIDFSVESYYPHGDEDLEFYNSFKQQFKSGIDEESIFIIIQPANGIFQQSFLQKVDSLRAYIESMQNILKVYSLTSSKYYSIQNGAFNVRPVIQIERPDSYVEDSTKLFQSPEFRDLLISKSGRGIGIVAFHEEKLTFDQKEYIIQSIKNIIEDLGLHNTAVTSKLHFENAYIKEIQKNLITYSICSIFLVCLILVVIYRSIKLLWVPLVVILMSIIWTLAMMALFEYPLGIVTSLLPPIIATISLSIIIHFSAKYAEILKEGSDKNSVFNVSIKEIGIALFFTTLTTAVGFYTLAITQIIPIKIFGMIAGSGIIFSFIICYIVLNYHYVYSTKPFLLPKLNISTWGQNYLHLCLLIILKYRKLVMGVLLIIFTSAIYYSSKIQIDGNLISEIPKDHPMLTDYQIMQKEFGGIRTFELALFPKTDTISLIQLEVFNAIEELEIFLKDSCHVTFLISPLSLVKGARKAFNGGENAFYKLPVQQQELETNIESILQTEYASELERYLLHDGSSMRLSGKLPDLSIIENATFEKNFKLFFEQNYLNQSFDYKFTGTNKLLDKLAFYLTQNLIFGLGIAFLLIALISMFLLKSAIMSLIAILPNLIAILIMSGIMGFTHISLKADTAIIFSISFGIAVDNTIHFLNRMRVQLSKKYSLIYAVKRSYLTIGNTMFINTLVLLAGFLCLLSSSFGATYNIGLLISITLISAFILNMTLLPLLLIYCTKQVT